MHRTEWYLNAHGAEAKCVYAKLFYLLLMCYLWVFLEHYDYYLGQGTGKLGVSQTVCCKVKKDRPSKMHLRVCSNKARTAL